MNLDSTLKLRGILPAPVQPQQWIKFSDLAFAGPKLLGFGPSYSFAGLYAIMVIDMKWRPLPYRVIYFGEAGNMADRLANHEKRESWKRAAGGSVLFVAVRAISVESARKAAEERLIGHYSPECNVIHNSLAALLGY
jgi:hypothetical protein